MLFSVDAGIRLLHRNRYANHIPSAPLKILYDYGAFLDQKQGGVTRIMNEIIRREIQRNSVECQVYAGFHKNTGLHEIACEFPNNVHEFLLPQSIAKQRVFLPINNALFVQFAKRFAPDICHYTFFKTPKVPVKTKTVVTIHDLIFEIFLKTDNQVNERRDALSKVDGIICVSNNTKNDLLKFYDVGNKPILVAYHGNDLNSSRAVPPDVDVPYLLYVGNRGSLYKNFELVLKAFAKSDMLKPLSLVCFGGRPFDKTEWRTILKAGLANRVFHRSGSDDTLAGFYQNAIALIYPSRYEGFGLPPIEAMACRCPVLASNAAPMPEIIGNAALFFDPNSEDDLLNAISILLHQPEVRKSLIDNGLERTRFFSWDKTALLIHQFYQNLLES